MTKTNRLWSVPPRQVTLYANEVHVWRASLQTLNSNYHFFRRVLSLDEHERAAKFYFEKENRCWTIARGILRVLLGHYLGVCPAELRFVTGDYGKPMLASPLTEKNLQFNLSHSGDLALYAFAYGRQVGIDVERVRDGVEHDKLARAYFSASERSSLLELPLSKRREAFFLCWSRKEAYIKAKGKGLSIPLDQFDVSLTPGEPAALLASREELHATERWSMHALDLGAPYVGAVAVEGTGWQLRCWQWQKVGGILG